jgi:predicted kinase
MSDSSRLLILMCGLPFAGKSTLAARIAEALHLPIVSLDAVNTARGIGLRGESISPAQWAETYAETYRQLETLIAAGSGLIYDHANFTRDERDAVRAIAARHGFTARVIYLPVSPYEARARLQANRVTRGRHDVRDDDFDLVVHRFEPPDREADVVRYDPSMPLPELLALIRP